MGKGKGAPVGRKPTKNGRVTLAISVSAAEKAAIKKRAAEANQPVSWFVIEKCLGRGWAKEEE